jgi:hypothetical protein
MQSELSTWKGLAFIFRHFSRSPARRNSIRIPIRPTFGQIRLRFDIAMAGYRMLRLRAVTGRGLRMMSTKAFVPNPKDFQNVLEAMASPCREMGDRLEVCRELVHERWSKNQTCTAFPPLFSTSTCVSLNVKLTFGMIDIIRSKSASCV